MIKRFYNKKKEIYKKRFKRLNIFNKKLIKINKTQINIGKKE